MVWLPGEGYDFADARQFDGSFLASLGNVIVITVQYRVGVFGFLKTNSSAAGNMGLWDQIMALKWIRKNAKAIGADADNITVFGRFTGSMSISILLTSPVVRDMSPPLFRRAILLSGIAVGEWVFEHNHQMKAKEFLNQIGCDEKDTNCLKTISAQNILEKASYGWRPTFDSDLIEAEPLKVLESGNFANGVTDVMLGTNKVEGSLCLLTHFASKSRYYDKIINNELTENDFLEMIESDMKMFFNQKHDSNGTTSYQNRAFISALVNKNQNSSYRQKYLEFCSSLFITSHMKNFNKLLLKRQLTKQNDMNTTPTNTFAYELQYRPSFSIAPSFIDSAIHGDDVLLAFGLIHGSPVIPNKDDEKMTQLLVQSFTNFATYGNPNGLGPKADNLWLNSDISVIKTKMESNKTKDNVVSVTQLFLFSSTAEMLITFLSTSTTILALLATSLICFIIFFLHKQRHTTNHYNKDSALL
ncbi:unnamed protein product [Medioppia subpectinata]|uniref:Carboxylesterase type B domain-containing protein n=1 Tax=Medioppia subpectinata TaxID=1979941 RepID=A0A7R9Q314_9ACAR|nr:unnamed protein product [Medioppia subpectinata]CAG2109998.1 unnamed protein product [Medioppia subpectinata]